MMRAFLEWLSGFMRFAPALFQLYYYLDSIPMMSSPSKATHTFKNTGTTRCVCVVCAHAHNHNTHTTKKYGSGSLFSVFFFTHTAKLPQDLKRSRMSARFLHDAFPHYSTPSQTTFWTPRCTSNPQRTQSYGHLIRIPHREGHSRRSARYDSPPRHETIPPHVTAAGYIPCSTRSARPGLLGPADPAVHREFPHLPGHQ